MQRLSRLWCRVSLPFGIAIGLAILSVALIRGDGPQAALGGFIIALWIPTSRRITCRLEEITRDRSPRAGAGPRPRGPRPR